jgi:O6-methylguanine-DNA--protein-cysteine methyltransferase
MRTIRTGVGHRFRALVRYFNGERVDIPWPVMDISRFTPSQQAVYRTVAGIPYGQTASYGQVARMAGLAPRRPVRGHHHGQQSLFPARY